MQSFDTNDNCTIKYIDTDPSCSADEKLILILLHGFTGSSLVFRKNIPIFSKAGYRVIAPDLRGHGVSEKTKYGYHVSRLAVDLWGLLNHLDILSGGGEEKKGGTGIGTGREKIKIKAIGTSLGAAILWSYAELFGMESFEEMVFVDQGPLQNKIADEGWDERYCNKGMNGVEALRGFKRLLVESPEEAHRGTVEGCLGYRVAFGEGEGTGGEEKEGRGENRGSEGKGGIRKRSKEEAKEDEDFFIGEAMKGDGWWYGKLMENHTGLDWRDSIRGSFNNSKDKEREEERTRVLVVASKWSGCFPPEGPLSVVGLINGDEGGGGDGKEEKEVLAKGVVVDWGGHWCYWEEPERFCELVFGFFDGRDVSE